MKFKKGDISICTNCGNVTAINNLSRMLCKECYINWYENTPKRKQSNRARQARNRKLDPARFIEYQLKSIAKKKGIAYDLDREWIREKLNHGYCEVTGLPLVQKEYKEADIGVQSFFAPSVDRIDNSLGYIPTNCRMIIWGYNLSKNNYTEREILSLSLGLVLSTIPPAQHAEFKSLLPNYVLATLPSNSHRI